MAASFTFVSPHAPEICVRRLEDNASRPALIGARRIALETRRIDAETIGFEIGFSRRKNSDVVFVYAEGELQARAGGGSHVLVDRSIGLPAVLLNLFLAAIALLSLLAGSGYVLVAFLSAIAVLYLAFSNRQEYRSVRGTIHGWLTKA
jgi:hypothetical protein